MSKVSNCTVGIVELSKRCRSAPFVLHLPCIHISTKGRATKDATGSTTTIRSDYKAYQQHVIHGRVPLSLLVCNVHIRRNPSQLGPSCQLMRWPGILRTANSQLAMPHPAHHVHDSAADMALLSQLVYA